MRINRVCLLCFSVLLLFFLTNEITAQIEKFQPKQADSEVDEVWRLTNEPACRDWASYHSTECFSPDGRYIVYIHFGADPNELNLPSKAEMKHDDLYHPTGTPGGRQIILYDLFRDQKVKFDFGKYATNPRWAFNHNWLFFNRSSNSEVMWLDVDKGKVTKIAEDIQVFSTDYEDNWIYGTRTNQDGKMDAVRMEIKGDSRAEVLQGSWERGGNLLYLNPAHPVIVSRDNRFKQYYYATSEWKPAGYLGKYNIPFVSRHFFTSDLEGGNRTLPFPEMEGAHFSWTGDGSYFVCGNGPFRGWKWDDPLPGNLHILGGMVRTSDPSPCGRSGRWISGSSSGALWLLDIRAGDGFSYLDAFSHIHDSGTFSYCQGSGLSDNDAKGSPDGTKISFVTNYDLKDAPVTKITDVVPGVTGKKIPVESTQGFPESGRLSIQNEVIGYKSKTSTSFNDITRNLYDTHPLILEHLTPEIRARFEARPVDLNKGQTITSFDSRVIPEEEWKKLPVPAKIIGKYGDIEITPLLRQKQTDIYIAVVRLPDRPLIRKIKNVMELIQGENHLEIRCYNIYKNSGKIYKSITAGETIILEAGEYSATAQEWSGLESKKSSPVKINEKTKLEILKYKPSDFSWTSEHWFIDGQEVSETEARNRQESMKEIHHVYEGIISREWFNWGQISKRYDLSAGNEEPTRKLYYNNGLLYKRDYYHRSGWLATTEYFNPEGDIVESIYYNQSRNSESREYRHWWYKENKPVKCIRDGEVYFIDNEVWKKQE